MLVFSEATSDRRILKEAKALCEIGYGVTVLYPSEKNKKKSKIGKVIFVPVKTGPWTKTPLRFAVFWLCAFFAGNHPYPDAVHCHDANTLPAGYCLSRMNHCKFIYDSHEFATGVKELRKKRFKRCLWAMTEIYFAGKADAVITVNRHLSRMLRRYRKLQFDPDVVMNASDLIGSVKNDKKKAGKKRIVYHSALVPGRGFEKILEAVSRLEGVQLTVFGSGSSEIEFKRFAGKIGADVVFAGWAEGKKLSEGLAEADAGLSLISGNCINNRLSSANKIFDYACLGIPQVGSRHPVMRDLIEKKGVGLCADESDTESIVSAVNKILFDEKTRGAILENLMLKKSEYSWESEKKKLQALYVSFFRQGETDDRI